MNTCVWFTAKKSLHLNWLGNHGLLPPSECCGLCWRLLSDLKINSPERTVGLVASQGLGSGWETAPFNNLLTRRFNHSYVMLRNYPRPGQWSIQMWLSADGTFSWPLESTKNYKARANGFPDYRLCENEDQTNLESVCCIVSVDWKYWFIYNLSIHNRSCL